MFDTDNFGFTIPLDIVKSSPKSNEMRIAGFASTSHKDREDDEVMQKGLDISDFVNYGYLNLDHDNSYILGYPDKEKTKVTAKGFWVEGILLKGVPQAERLYQTAVALRKSNAPRKLGFSVEGKTLERDALGRIVKAKIYNVAVTANPVNPEATWDVLVKSFAHKDNDLGKAMEAGYGVEIGQPSNGSALIPESLDSALRDLSYVIGNDNAMDEFKRRLDGRGDLSDNELILYFQVTKGLSRSDSAALVNKLKIK